MSNSNTNDETPKEFSKETPPKEPSATQPKNSGFGPISGTLIRLIDTIVVVKLPVQLAAFAVTAALIIIIYVSGRSNIASILSTGSIGVSVILFAQIVPICQMVGDDKLKVKLIIVVFAIFLIAVIPLTYFAIHAISNSAVAFHSQALSHLAKGECLDAQADADQVVALDHAWAEGYNDRGAALFCLNNYQSAERDFRNALQHDRHDDVNSTVRYQFNLAAVLIRLDATRSQKGAPIVNKDEALALLKNVDDEYQKERGQIDAETKANEALAFSMYDECSQALEATAVLTTLRKFNDVRISVSVVCNSVGRGMPSPEQISKKLPENLQWIAKDGPPEDSKFDYLIPVQIALHRK